MPGFKDHCNVVVISAAVSLTAACREELLSCDQRCIISNPLCRYSLSYSCVTDMQVSSFTLLLLLYVRKRCFGHWMCQTPWATGCGIPRKLFTGAVKWVCPLLFIGLVAQPQSSCEGYGGKASLGKGQKWDEQFLQGWFGFKHSAMSWCQLSFWRLWTLSAYPSHHSHSHSLRNWFKTHFSLVWKEAHLISLPLVIIHTPTSSYYYSHVFSASFCWAILPPHPYCCHSFTTPRNLLQLLTPHLSLAKPFFPVLLELPVGSIPA